MSKNWNLTGGVIIIGSLLWQDHLNNQYNIRKNWRNYYLDKKSKIMVKLPIRYGRYSNKDDIYTMVFSNNCQRYKRLGTGYIFQFKSNPIKNFKQLLFKVKAMSKAEGMKGNFWGGNRDIWGNMGILFNNSKINNKIKKDILCKWEKKFFDNNKNLKFGNFKFSNEHPCISNKGELTLKWIEPVDKRDSKQVSKFDFLIATATKPQRKTKSLKCYPKDIKEIVALIKRDTNRFYFINNLKRGITTFQDNAILNEL
jgi:hypothetical protein